MSRARTLEERRQDLRQSLQVLQRLNEALAQIRGNQMDLFGGGAASAPFVEELMRLDLSQVTPLQALLKLNECTPVSFCMRRLQRLS